MTDTLQNFAIAVMQDVCSLVGIPCASTATAIYQEIQARRLDAARNIAIEELGQGHRRLSSMGELDEQVAILHRYFRAANEGTARLNLRLLAKIIAGHSEQAPLRADDFMYYADILSSLRREEVILLGTLYRHTSEERERGEMPPEVAAERKTREELIPTVFASQDEYLATAGALMRTGLIIIQSGWGGDTHRITPIMYKLAGTVSFEAAVQAETTAQAAV